MTPKFTPSQLILGKTASLLMHAIRATLKWESEGLRDQNGVHWSCGKPVIIAFWHSQQLLMPWIFREGRGEPGHEPVYAMVSQHGDGRLAASLLEQLSIRTIGGSSSKGGMAAMLKLAKLIRKKSHAAITPDGPTGPVEVAKPGITKLASVTGAPIMPVALQIDRHWSFNSWDALVFPKPFAKVSVIMGEPLVVARNADRDELEGKASELTEILKALNIQASERLKHTPEQ